MHYSTLLLLLQQRMHGQTRTTSSCKLNPFKGMQLPHAVSGCMPTILLLLSGTSYSFDLYLQNLTCYQNQGWHYLSFHIRISDLIALVHDYNHQIQSVADNGMSPDNSGSVVGMERSVQRTSISNFPSLRSLSLHSIEVKDCVCKVSLKSMISFP